MQLDIFLRTYDGDSVHPRRFDKPKKDIVWRCVRSLCTAIKALPEQPHLTILDDHSTAETVQFLRDETAFLGENITIQTLEGTGNNDSMLAGLTLAKESTADLVYVVEDDYLHYPNALTVALETWKKFRPCCPLPFMAMTLVDCPSNYIDEPDDLEGLPRNDRGDGSIGMIVGGTDRPWRTIGHTGVTFLLEKGVLQKHWEPFNEIARYWPYLEERCTINKLWNTEVGLFGPLVPLSYHLWENHPFFPVDDLWEQNEKKIPTKIKRQAQVNNGSINYMDALPISV